MQRQFNLPGAQGAGGEFGGSTLTIFGLKNFYYLPTFHGMRCKARRVSEIIRTRYHRDPLSGDVYIFMSKDQKKVKMIHSELSEIKDELHRTRIEDAADVRDCLIGLSV